MAGTYLLLGEVTRVFVVGHLKSNFINYHQI